MAVFSTLRWWNRLGAKLSALTVAGAVATIGVLGVLSISVQQSYFVDEVERGAQLVTDTIKSSIYHHMLADQRPEAYRSMETIGRQPIIDRLRMYNRIGEITFSNTPEEVGTTADLKAPACVGCHGDGAAGARPLPFETSSYTAHGHRNLELVTPIYNEPSCSSAACHAHPPTQRVLGVIELGLSLEQSDRATSSLETISFFGLVVSMLLSVIGVVLLNERVVLRPVRALLDATRRIAQNDLELEIPRQAPDEIGQLVASFNAMTSSLRTERAERLELLEGLEEKVAERTAALRQAQAQLIQSEKMSSLGKLSASIAHEINNPLMGILTISKLLIRTMDEGRSEDPRNANAIRQLKMVQRETERCSAIVRNLLDFARQRPLAVKGVDVNAALEESLSVASNQIAIQGIALKKDLKPLPMVQADFGQLRQAFLNVILNSCEAMAKGGTLTISSRFAEGARGIEVEIADTGGGIPPEVLPKIFDPFFTTKEKGTGLGLSVVYGIVQRHGGTLEVKSQQGQGTQMFFRIPMAAPPDAQAA
jgi:two-component system NtrC family sensor kinase